MNLIKKIWNKIKAPHGFWLVLFYIAFVALVASSIVLVCVSSNQTIWHYILYMLSAIALTYFVYTMVIFAPKMKEIAIKILKKFKFTNTMLESYGYRTIIFSIFSFIINISFVIFQGVLAFMTLSAWYISITAYYLVLAIMKGNVFYNKKKYTDSFEKQVKNYRYTGIMFILLTIAFSGIILLIYTSNMYFEYAGLMIYVVATYTFYKLGLAIYNIFKARKQNDLYIQTIRNINLANALISIVVLQVALFQAFSPEHNTSFANGLTGGVVSANILVLGIFMIIKANKMLNSQKGETNEK